MKITRLFILMSLCFVLNSCAWENDDLTDLYDLFYVERNGARMPVHLYGNLESKVVIVLLHGGPGGNGLEYRPGVFENVLEEKYGIAYFDQRGQGMAQGHLDAENSTVAEMVEDIHSLAQVLKHKYGDDLSLFLLGHSWGGTLGTAYMSTKDYQHEFKGWVEVDGAHDFDLMVQAQKRLVKEVGTMQIQENQSTEFWTEFIDLADKVDSINYTQDDVTELNGSAFDAESKLIEAGLIIEDKSTSSATSILIRSYMLNTNPLTSLITGGQANSSLVENEGIFSSAFQLQLDQIQIPTLLLWGKYDFVVPAELGTQALNEISSEHKRLVIYENSGHSPMDDQGLDFSQDLSEFIEEFK